jgi:hypothetical protein
MLHIHFGAGRLGLGLVAPFFAKPDSELFLLNRAQSGRNETGSTELSPERNAQLLRENPQRKYGIQTPGEAPGLREIVNYSDFFTYDPPGIQELSTEILTRSSGTREAIFVTASVLKLSNYGPVISFLNAVCKAKEAGEEIGDIFLLACENTVSAHEVFAEEIFRDLIAPEACRHTHCVHALVDRMCVGLEEFPGDQSHIKAPTVLVRAEEYGSLKLQLAPETQSLVDLCRGSSIEFSKHLDVEKKIKGWLLNGTHWLIALTAFQASEGDTNRKLNQYLAEHPERQAFAAQVIREISDGIEIILREDPQYADFVRDISPRAYLLNPA